MPANKEVDEHPVKQSIVAQLLIAGSAACIADIATFPFDTAKGECCKVQLSTLVAYTHYYVLYVIDDCFCSSHFFLSFR